MNARAYFQILRPGRTLIGALVSGLVICSLLHFLFRASVQETLLFSLAVVGPVFLGSLLLGPIHEVMHRSFSPTLPDVRRRLRRWHLRGVAVASILLFIPSALFVTDIPDVALYGLIVAGLSLPVLNRRRRTWGLIRPQYYLLILVGIVLGITARSTLAAVCREAPWAVLVGGLGFAWVCFRIGFSSSRVRDRWRDPLIFCFQSTVPFLGSDIWFHAQAQERQLARERVRRHGRDWNVTSIGSSLRDWVRVVHHARFGLISRLRIVVAGATPVPVFIGTAYLMAKFSDAPMPLALFCQHVVEAAKVHGGIDHAEVQQVITLSPVLGYGIALLAAMQASLPACSFPISRERLANCLFIDAHLLAASVYASYVLGMVLSYFGASLIAGLPFEVGMLSKPLAAVMLSPLAITLSLGICFLPGKFSRYLAGGFAFIGFIMVLVFIEKTNFDPLVVSPLRLLACLAATGLAGWLRWLAFRRYYRTCDLNQPLAWLRKLGLGGA